MFADLSRSLGDISAAAENDPDVLSDPVVQLALAARGAYLSRNYARFMRLYRRSPPKMCAFLLAWTVDRLRPVYLRVIIKAYEKLMMIFCEIK